MPTDTLEAPASQPTEAQPAPSGSEPSPVTEVTTPPAAAPGSQEATQERAAEVTDPLDGIDKHDPATLLEKHPGLKRYLDSKAGEIKSRDLPKLEKEIEARVRAQVLQEIEDQRLAAAADADDAYGVLEAVKQRRQTQAEREQQTLAQQQEAARLEMAAGQRLGQVALAAIEKLPEPIQAALKGPDGTFERNWGGDGTAAGGVAEMIQTAISAGIESGIKPRLAKLVEEGVAARLKELNGESLGDEPSPDTRGGSPAAGAMTRAEYVAHEHDPAWIKTNRQRIGVWLAAGQPP